MNSRRLPGLDKNTPVTRSARHPSLVREVWFPARKTIFVFLK